MTLEHKEGERNQGFSIRVEKPENVYRYLKSQIPFLLDYDKAEYAENLELDLPATDIDENLSETNFDGELFENEFTDISLSGGSSVNHEKGLSLHSKLNYTEGLRVNKRFYSFERVKNIQDMLSRKSFETRHLNHEGTNMIDVYDRSKGIKAVIDFGKKDFESFVFEKIKNDVDRYERENKNLIDYIESLSAGITEDELKGEEFCESFEMYLHERVEPALRRHGIKLDLWAGDEGCIGVLDMPKDEQSFKEIMKFYARTYEEVIKSLHEEAGVSLPKTPIILKSKHDISTILRLD